ncbi:MAG: RNA polymerase sigma-70 factor [Balneolaceae bacterium]
MEKNLANRGTDDAALYKELAFHVSSGDEEAFKKIFFDYYYPLCRFAFKFTRSKDLARDTVQEVFYKIWKNRKEWNIDYSVNAYLYRAVRNQALNLIELEQSKERACEEMASETSFESRQEADYPDPLQELSDRMQKIWNLIENLPEQQRTVFELHRKEGLSYIEISTVLEIAPKTVENHMGRALKFLRENLKLDQPPIQKS